MINYRLYVIGRMPNLRILDFKKISKKERQDAAKLLEVMDAKKEIEGKPK